MPELPEVETIRQDLKKKIVNKKITNVLITTKARVNPDHKEFVKNLKGRKFVDIDRVGKLLIFDIDLKDKFLLVHLKMTGQLIYQKGKKIIPGGHHDLSTVSDLPNKFTRITFEFVDGGKLFFNDMRRFGYLKIVGSKELEKVKSKFGIEPLTKDFTIDNFKKVLQGRKTNIKALLLNQQLFAGIGNIYADEACFEAGILPSAKVSKLTSQQVTKLHKSVEKIIKKAIEMRGTTFNNYRDSDGNKGNFVQYLKVYDRVGLKCKRCSGIIEKTRVAGRGTHFCLKCQK